MSIFKAFEAFDVTAAAVALDEILARQTVLTHDDGILVDDLMVWVDSRDRVDSLGWVVSRIEIGHGRVDIAEPDTYQELLAILESEGVEFERRWITAGSREMGTTALLAYHGPIYLYTLREAQDGDRRAFYRYSEIVTCELSFQRGFGLERSRVESVGDLLWASEVARERTDRVLGFGIERSGLNGTEGFWSIEETTEEGQ